MGYPDFERQALPTVVCLCGSVRFAEAFTSLREAETLEGRIVVGPEVMNVALSGSRDAVKTNLDALHLRKIDLADEILVVNVGGYYGESTTREIEYARLRGKKIRWLEPVETSPLTRAADALDAV
jgi:hypothetical protein